ncbi:hypothetical protein Y032_0016g3155 [Ancylostoma ceylanicum]|uniref:CXXC-type zinc finger protein 1 n=2 Tax=Ancylostoma ceylanicum TaxID=53326 RepID=A0A016V687_9BILA|nr:hypothetical protein Y032_0016g3155 [Ancylostoma ceylanicum]
MRISTNKQMAENYPYTAFALHLLSCAVTTTILGRFVSSPGCLAEALNDVNEIVHRSLNQDCFSHLAVKSRIAYSDKDMDERRQTRRSCTHDQSSRRREEAPKKLCLLTLKPGNSHGYSKDHTHPGLAALEEFHAIHENIRKIEGEVETLFGYVRAIQQYVVTMKSNTSIVFEEPPEEVDFVASCPVCGAEVNATYLPIHIERCFVRSKNSKKQAPFGTDIPAPFNPDNLLCDFYNRSTNTYCKRIRVACSEHYKGELENDLKFCAYPEVWAEGKSLTFAEMFSDGPDLLKGKGFCCVPRKKCSRHHRWIQTLMGTIECDRMNLLSRLNELLERRKVVAMGCAIRGDVISLMNFSEPIIPKHTN